MSQIGVEHQFRHPHHAIHGGADFVAHIRQKLTFRTASEEGLFFSLQELFLNGQFTADIAQDQHGLAGSGSRAEESAVIRNRYAFAGERPQFAALRTGNGESELDVIEQIGTQEGYLL